ncbi:MAG: hypothetical protein Q8932_02990 [Bacteroidota bacterium]|nr:hypothetical protein [Bacteroidota bacterium]
MMQKLIPLLVLLSLRQVCQAQIFKKIGQKAKDEVEYRVQRKAGQKIDQGLDSALAMPKKIIDKENAKKNTGTNSLNASAEDPEDMSQKDGFVKFELSATTLFAGGILSITGESVKYKNYNQVEVTVSGRSVKDVRSVPLAADGKFATAWFAPDKAGNYTATVKGSDKKSAQSIDFTVYDLPKMNSWCDENISVTNKAYDQLKEAVEEVKTGIGSKDKEELDQKLEEVKEKVDKLLKLYKDLNTAGKDLAALAKTGKNLSPNLAGNLSDLNNRLAEQRRKMKQIEEYSNHKPADNTVCEYLVMANEACAAFSVYTNIEGIALKGILQNIMLDKGVPLAVSTVNQKAGGLSQPNDFAIKEPAKIFSTALLDVNGLNSKLGTAGFAGDIAQFATDFLMKKYCGVFKGRLIHDYSIEFRNSKQENWWTYGVQVKAALYLRYPKDKAGGNIIKMKGNLEGNGTKFSFFEDIEKEDGFQDGSKGKIEVVPIKAYTPFSVSQATSELDVMGFGAIARGLATPAYFNIPLDAEYDVNANKIKIFLNAPIIDFSPAVSNQLVFLLIGGDLLPYVKRMSFPIHKVFRTLGSVVRSNNEFEVKNDKTGNLSFTGKANKHLGSKADKIEHDLNFTITATKQ